jgi:hypothetical protein
MAKEINTEITIQASAAKVWSILTDFENYPGWNPYIKYVKGTVQAGNKINVCIEPPNAKPMVFYPKVLTCEPYKKISWLGRLYMPGLFDGEHTFTLIDNGNGTTTFKHSETFKGILLFLMNIANVTKGFESMNLKLKVLAEQ